MKNDRSYSRRHPDTTLERRRTFRDPYTVIVYYHDGRNVFERRDGYPGSYSYSAVTLGCAVLGCRQEATNVHGGEAYCADHAGYGTPYFGIGYLPPVAR